MTELAWVGVVVASLVIAYVARILLWPSWKDIPRENFAHYIQGLIRFYDDSAWIAVTAKVSSTCLFRFSRATTLGDNGCILLFEILDSPSAARHRDALLNEINEQGYDAALLGEAEDDWLIRVKIKIEDIWQVSSGNLAARLAHAALDVMGIDKEARFSISGKGPRSRERTLEARRRQKEGFDLTGIDLKK